MSGGASIYIMLCADGGYYTGITRRSLKERLSEHVNGAFPDCYTFHRRPVVLAYSEFHERIAEAVATERRIKARSRAKKAAYVKGEFDRLSKLAKRRGGSG